MKSKEVSLWTLLNDLYQCVKVNPKSTFSKKVKTQWKWKFRVNFELDCTSAFFCVLACVGRVVTKNASAHLAFIFRAAAREMEVDVMNFTSALLQWATATQFSFHSKLVNMPSRRTTGCKITCKTSQRFPQEFWVSWKNYGGCFYSEMCPTISAISILQSILGWHLWELLKGCYNSCKFTIAISITLWCLLSPLYIFTLHSLCFVMVKVHTVMAVIPNAQFLHFTF